MEGHGQYLLVSTPRSGSDWFAQVCLGWEPPRYQREFFNPSYNLTSTAVLRQVFGSELDWEAIALPWEHHADLCEIVYRSTWAALRREHPEVALGKEVWGGFKIGFYRRHFELFALVGHRSHTFPGRSKPKDTQYWWLRYYQSLALNRDLLDEDLARLVDAAAAGATDLPRKLCAAQILATYQTVRECSRLGAPILEYRRLAACATAAEALAYLDGKVPATFLSPAVAERVVRTRDVADKAAEYEAWGTEEFCRDLIARIPAEHRDYF